MRRAAPRSVLFVDASPFLGGAARSLLDLLGALPPAEVRPVLVAACEELRLAASAVGLAASRLDFPAPSRNLAPWRSLPALGRILAVRRELAEIAGRAGVELVHANSTWAHLVAGDLLGLPSVWHCRDLTGLGMLSVRLADTASAVVATSRGVAGHLAAQGIPAELVRVIHNGVSLAGLSAPEERPALRERLRAEWGLPSDAPVLAWAGEFAPWKRTEDFLAAIAELRRSHPSVRGLILGAALAESHQGRQIELEALANRMGIGAAVRFLGWRPDVPRCLAAADLLMLTSENEPFGRILVEAMAVGLPIVARNGGGVSEVLGAGTGLIIEAPSAADLAAAAARLLNDRSETAAMAAAGVRRAREMFSPELAAERIGRLYDEIAP
jgi:glycosyltransferase involved in cell wall biosynthesis